MASDFRESAALMATQLRVMQRLQNYHREVGDTEVLLDVRDLFSPADAAALAAYERDLEAVTGRAVPLPLGVAG